MMCDVCGGIVGVKDAGTGCLPQFHYTPIPWAREHLFRGGEPEDPREFVEGYSNVSPRAAPCRRVVHRAVKHLRLIRRAISESLA